MPNKLAIVIPAFKSRFFKFTLESIANQSCKDFTLYVGDDASPDNIENIVNQYSNSINISYKRFHDNLGGNDLIAHWERCVDLIKDEEWIWFFSDDDVMTNNCVEGFFETLKLYNAENLNNKVLRFNLSITDQDLNIVQKYLTPATFSVEYFLEKQFISHTLANRAVEFIFSKKAFYDKGKFVNFPLAWGSDKATILKLGHPDGFITMVKGEVLWRSSDFNISGIPDKALDEQKSLALNQRNQWMFGFIQDFRKNRFFYGMVYRIMHHITSSQAFSILRERGLEDYKLRCIVWLLGVFIKLKKTIRFKKIKQGLSGLSIRKSKAA